MKKRRSTKVALLLSVLSLLLCLSMFVGSTFAWFSDGTTSGSNVIQAGSLEIVLEMYDAKTETWVDASGKVIPFVAADGRTEILWEPGCTYQMAPIRVRNVGTLASYMMISIKGIDGDAKLLEALAFSTVVSGLTAAQEQALIDAGLDSGAPDQKATFAPLTGTENGTLLWDAVLLPADDTKDGHISNTVTFCASMRSDAGNEFQGLAIDGITITVLATQYMHESDGFGSDYDQYSKVLQEAGTASIRGLKAALSAGGSLALTGNVVFTGINSGASPIFGSETIAAAAQLDLNGRDIVNASAGGEYNFLFYLGDNGALTIAGDGTVRFDRRNGAISAGKNTALIYAGGNSAVTIKSGTFDGTSGSENACAVWAAGTSRVVIEGGTFICGTGERLLYRTGEATIVITGGTFVNFDPTDYLASGYTVTKTIQGPDICYQVVPETAAP